MGLFVTEDGHYQGWLAAFLCCVAGMTDDEHPVERAKSRPSTRTNVCIQQPILTALPPLQSAASPLASADDKNGLRIDHHAHSVPAKSIPALRPLDFGSSSLLDRRPSNPSPRLSPGHPPSVGPSHRHDQFDTQRQTLVPRKIAPVVLRDAPNPDALAQPSAVPVSARQQRLQRSDSTQNLLSHTEHETPSRAKESPFQRSMRNSTDALIARQSQLCRPSIDERSDLATEGHGMIRPTVYGRSSSTSLRRHAIEANLASSTTTPTSSSDARSPSPTRLKRKPSATLSRRLHVDDSDSSAVEKDTLELNTIVEEQKAEQHRAATPDGHVPAVAPSMQVRARSETLNDIGSALSRPLTAREHVPWDTLLHRDVDDHRTRPSTTAHGNKVLPGSSSRVSGWLSNILGPNNSSNPPPPPESFYKCATATTTPTRTRTHSTASHSSSSSATHAESPTMTTASSPHSKGHARSLTSESKVVAARGSERACDERRWPPPLVHKHSQVGLAF